MKLYQLIDQVVKAREAAARATDSLDDIRARWEEGYREVISAAKESKEAVAAAETELRDATIEAYRETGNKAPARGVGVRVSEELNYDVADALRWATEHDMALALDKRAFEAIAKVDKKMAFVTRTEKVTATIASDLAVARHLMPTIT